jgi:Mn2+/Fe2+ NRAMP family transporter
VRQIPRAVVHRISLLRVFLRRPLVVLRALRPGLIAGASDNDPTTVGTLAVVGASTGYALSWLAILVIPMLVVVQVISAAVGVCAEHGLEHVIRRHWGRAWALLVLVLVLGVNLLTLAADLEGGGAALGLLTGRPYALFVGPFALVSALLLLLGGYRGLARVLRYVLLLFLAYVLAAVLAHPNWGQVFHETLLPSFSLAPAVVAGALALLGTTLTSYCYVWETIEESEERTPLRRLGLAKLDAGAGMVLSGLVSWFIIIATAATLGVHHHAVHSVQDAASALAPLSGQFASTLFGIGLLASAFLAVPILAGTSAYVIGDAFGWRGGLTRPFHRARPFYMVLLLSLAVGAAFTLIGIDPIHLLFVSSLVGGLATPVTLVFMLLAARDRRVMGDSRISGRLAGLGWLVTGLVTAASVIFLWQTLVPGR